MYWKIVYWIITRILWRASKEIGSMAKVEMGWKLWNWFTPYPEYKGYDWTIKPSKIKVSVIGKDKDWNIKVHKQKP